MVQRLLDWCYARSFGLFQACSIIAPKERLFCNGQIHGKTILLNTGQEVFTEPCGLNKVLWKEKKREWDKERIRGRWKGLSVSYIWEGARVGSAACSFFFFLTLIKSRELLQWKKHDKKQSSHELNVQGGGDMDWKKQLLTSTMLMLKEEKEGRVGQDGKI